MISYAISFHDWNPRREWVLSPSVAKSPTEGHIPRLILRLVQVVLYLSPVCQSCKTGAGQPQNHPAMMSATFLLACCKGIRFAEKLAKVSQKCLDFLTVSDRQQPEHCFFARCCKCNHKTLSWLFDQTVKLCCEQKNLSLGQAAVDSPRNQANASNLKAMRDSRIRDLRPNVAQSGRSAGMHPAEVLADTGFYSDDKIEYMASLDIRFCLDMGRQKHDLSLATGGRFPSTDDRRQAMGLRQKHGGQRSCCQFYKQTIETALVQNRQALGFRKLYLRCQHDENYEWGIGVLPKNHTDVHCCQT